MAPRFLPFLCILLTLALAPAAWADTVILKSGERLEGNIVSQTDSAIVIDVRISAGITDQKTILRDDIEQIDQASPADLAWKEIENIKPTPMSRTIPAYDQIIPQLERFLRNYPDSKFASVVKERVDIFTDARERVKRGEMKVDFKWLSAEEAARRKYQIEAKLLAAQMQDYASHNDLVSALNAFDKIENQYPGSRAYAESIPVARQLLAGLGTNAARRYAQLQRDEKERQEGVAITSEPQKSQLIAAYEREQAQFKAVMEDLRTRNVKWWPIMPRNEANLTYLATTAVKEDERLAGINTTSKMNAVQLVQAAEAAMEKGDFDTAEANLTSAASAWPEYEATALEQKRLADLKAGNIGIPADSAASTGSIPVAQGSPAPGAEESPGTSPAASPTPSPSPAETPAPAEIEAEPTPDATPAPKPFYLTVSGAAIIFVGILVLAGIASLISGLSAKRKAKELDAEDTNPPAGE